MWKNSLFVILSFLSIQYGYTQYGNEWIDYERQYYAIKVYEDGVYKLDYAYLEGAGIPVSTIAPDNFKLVGFEKEQPLWVEDGDDGSFDPGDFLVFYGQKNNTWLDSLLYDEPDMVSNKYYPLYNDSIHYYLTWTEGDGNLRFQEETDVDFGAYSAVPYFLKTSYKSNQSQYIEGFKVSGMSASTYTEAEGWFGPRVFMAAGINYHNDIISTTNRYTGAGAPVTKGIAVSAGVSNATYTGSGNHHLQLQYGLTNTLLKDTIYSGYKRLKLEFTIPTSELGASTTRIRHQLINDLGVASDYQCVAYSELIYPHTPALEGESYYEMTIPYNTTASKSHYEFTSFSASTPWAFTLNGPAKKIPVVVSGGTYEVLIPNLPTGEDQKFILVDEGSMKVPDEIQAINGTGFFTNYSVINFEEAYLLVTDASLWSSALDYQAYRTSLPGGMHNVVLVDANELNHQFGGGVEKHVMGLRRFSHYAYDQATEKPRYLFILGKGIREASESIATGSGTRQSPVAYENCKVPSFGYPASDVLITARLNGNLWAPLIPTGRLAAKSNEEVYIYLNKVEEYETQQDSLSVYNVEDKLWQKQILHFGGGANEIEQNTFKFYLSNYEGYLEDSKFGGNVTAYYKSVSDPVDPAVLSEVTEEINDGVSIMTFFGHASADGFDQNIDDPELWNNKGRYPVVVGNACLTGNIFEPNNLSASEEYVLIEDKGAILFLSNVKQAFSNSLDGYSRTLFSLMANAEYGEAVSVQSQKTIQSIQYEEMPFGLKNVCNQMTLHGDPAIKTNYHEAPELEINSTSMFFTPSVIDLTVDSIDVNIIIYNLGRSVLDTFAVELTRSFPNGGGDSLYTKLVHGIDYIDTVVFTIPFYNNVGVGINTFTASVDIPSLIVEQYDEVNNNIYSRQVLFDVDGIYPVWPYNYAVVPNDTITIRGSTVNPFAEVATYRFEIDTTDLYNSPEHRYNMQVSLGGVVEVEYDEWLNATTGETDQLILQDSMVYFWRVAVEDDGEYYWIEYSFQYIKGKSGWGQDHFFQFKNNEFTFLDYNRDSRTRSFGASFKTIDCDVYGNATGWFEAQNTTYRIDGNNLDEGFGEYSYCTGYPQLLVAVIDPITLRSWGTRWDPGEGAEVKNPDNNFGNVNDNGWCRPRVENYFSFAQHHTGNLMSFENMMLNEIPDNYYYLIYTSRYADYSAWNAAYPDVYNVFTELGCDSITPGKPEVPFIVFGKMGDTESTREVYGQYLNEFIQLKDTLWGFDLGAEASTVIGPSQQWESVYWKQDALEPMSEDSTRLKIAGVSAEGNEVLLIDTLFTSNDSILNLHTLIDENDYPFLRLSAQYWDNTDLTPAQIDRWHVLYEPAPEAALDGSAGLYWLPDDTLIEGQQIVVAFDIRNISNVPMDSLLVNYWIEDVNHHLIPIDYPRQDSLRVGETISDTLTIESISLQGLNSLWVEVNPYDNYGVTDQLEQYHYNNIGQIPFHVLGDEENPILDVTFNGYHILNGDLVDPASEILITLKDENEYLIMDEEGDTANFGIYITDPSGVQKRLNFRNALGEPLMEWVPADGGSKKFKIIYSGNFAENGTYRLLVQAIDKSGNISGDFDYDIEFEVDHNSSITHLMNYPNPFSTSTQFVFTLTGSTIPDEFTIQIMTVTGKVVREITKDELGPIRIGRNITEFKWNGTDEYGDILANGVYLYRVIVKIDNETIEHRETSADQYFTKDFGKMYIMR